MVRFFEEYLRHIYHTHTIAYDTRMNNRHFRTHLIKTLTACDDEETFHTVLRHISTLVLPSLRKPQHCLLSKEAYYIAWDMYTKTKYICYRDLVCLDYDVRKSPDARLPTAVRKSPDTRLPTAGVTSDDNTGENGEKPHQQNHTNTKPFTSKQDILDFVHTHPILSTLPTMRVETRNGYHIFLLDKARPHSDASWIKQMLAYQVDPYYAVYCYLRGYSIRLNPKENTPNDRVFFDISYTHKSRASPELIKLAHMQFRHVDYAYASEMT